MTSRVLGMYEVEAFDGAILSGTYAGLAESPSLGEAPAFTMQGDSLCISRAEGLKGAKGTLTAVGLEAGAAFCLYCIWQLWHLFR